MITPELQKYVSDSRAAGMSNKQIGLSLGNQGWAIEDINQALGLDTVKYLSATPTSAPSSDSKQIHHVSKWVWILIPFAVLLIFGAIITIALMTTSAPTKVARSFISDLSSNNVRAAYDLTSKDFHNQKDVSALQQLLVTNPQFTKISDITLNSRSVKNNIAEIKGTVTTDTGTYPLTVKLIKESGWKVYAFTVDFPPGVYQKNDQTKSDPPTPSQVQQSSKTQLSAVCEKWPLDPELDLPSDTFFPDSKLPENFPADIPIYPNAKLFGADQTEHPIIALCSNDSFETVAKYYQGLSNGWSFEKLYADVSRIDYDQTGKTWTTLIRTISGEKQDREIEVRLQEIKPETVIIINTVADQNPY